MTTSVQQILEAAYSHSTANDPGKLATDLELIGELDRTYQRLYAELAIASGDNALSASALTLAGSPASATLPTDVIDVLRVEKATDGSKVYLIPASEKDRAWHLSPAVYRQGTTLVSRNRAGDPVSGQVLSAYVLDAPAALTTLSDTLDPRWPHRLDSLLVLDLALYLSDKDVDRNPQDYTALRTEYRDELAAFASLVGNSNSAKETPHVGRSVASGQESKGS